MSDIPTRSDLENTRLLYDRLSRWYDLLSGPAERRVTLSGLDLLDLLPLAIILARKP